MTTDKEADKTPSTAKAAKSAEQAAKDRDALRAEGRARELRRQAKVVTAVAEAHKDLPDLGGDLYPDE